MTAKDRIDYARPRCPQGGSHDVREWDLVPVPYYAVELARNKAGDVYVSETEEGGLSPAWDCGEFDSLMCHECDYESSDPGEFFPEAAVVLGEN